MNEEQNKVNSDSFAGLEQANEDLYLYRWNYEEQRTHDFNKQKKERKILLDLSPLLIFISSPRDR